MVFVLEHLLSVVSEHIVLYVHQTVLHELHLGNTFGKGFYFLFLHVDLVLFHELIFREVPFELIEHLIEVFVQFLLGHLLVGLQYPTFEEINRELDLLHLLHHSGFDIHTEAVFGLLSQAALDILFDACTESFLIFRSLCTIYFCEQLSVHSARFYFGFRTFLFVLGDVLSEAVSIRLYLLVHHLFGCLDGVLRQFVLTVQLSIELRCYSDVESEGEGLLVIEIYMTLLCVGQRIA